MRNDVLCLSHSNNDIYLLFECSLCDVIQCLNDTKHNEVPNNVQSKVFKIPLQHQHILFPFLIVRVYVGAYISNVYSALYKSVSFKQ